MFDHDEKLPQKYIFNVFFNLILFLFFGGSVNENSTRKESSSPTKTGMFYVELFFYLVGVLIGGGGGFSLKIPLSYYIFS